MFSAAPRRFFGNPQFSAERFPGESAIRRHPLAVWRFLLGMDRKLAPTPKTFGRAYFTTLRGGAETVYPPPLISWLIVKKIIAGGVEIGSASPASPPHL